MRKKKSKSSGKIIARQIRESKAAAKAEIRKQARQAIAAIDRKFSNRADAAKSALAKFRPKNAERGKIIFVGKLGGRIGKNESRRGFAVYVNTKGKKQIVRQFDRRTGRLEKIPTAKKLTTLDVSRVRSKRAKKQFLTARLNPVAQRELRRKNKKTISSRGTRYEGKLETTQFYENSDSVQIIAADLARASNSQRSKRDFLVTIGISVREGKNGKVHWIELQRRFSRADGQTATADETRAFLGREVYAFLARELSDRGLVLEGSARHIGRLKENRGRARDEWTKDGFLWQGHDEKNVRIEKVEYRFDQLTLGK